MAASNHWYLAVTNSQWEDMKHAFEVRGMACLPSASWQITKEAAMQAGRFENCDMKTCFGCELLWKQLLGNS